VICLKSDMSQTRARVNSCQSMASYYVVVASVPACTEFVGAQSIFETPKAVLLRQPWPLHFSIKTLILSPRLTITQIQPAQSNTSSSTNMPVSTNDVISFSANHGDIVVTVKWSQNLRNRTETYYALKYQNVTRGAFHSFFFSFFSSLYSQFLTCTL